MNVCCADCLPVKVDPNISSFISGDGWPPTAVHLTVNSCPSIPLIVLFGVTFSIDIAVGSTTKYKI